MKKAILMLVAASAIIVGTTSCKKERMPKEAITQTETVNMNADESYTFTLPKNLRNDPYEITHEASHFSLSEVTTNASGDMVYKYTPANGYVGTDEVTLSNDQEREEHKGHPAGPSQGGHHKGNCEGGEEDHYIITIKFTVQRQQAVEHN